MSDESGMIDTSGTTTLPIDIEDELRNRFLEYSMSVIVARALPDVRDGLKPVHRRILYAMNESGLTPSRAYKKSAWTVGEVIGKYHPHGDSAVYDTMVRMAQAFSMRAAARRRPRQLRIGRRRPAAAYALHGVPPPATRDGAAARPGQRDRRLRSRTTTSRSPSRSVLPARYPNLLVNGSAGIAVGMATNIPPHNLGEVIDATVMLIDNPEATTEELMTVMPGPDFPTGGMIMGREGIQSARTRPVAARSRCAARPTSSRPRPAARGSSSPRSPTR